MLIQTFIPIFADMMYNISIPGYHRVQPNLTKGDQQVVLLSLNGKTSISMVLISELETGTTVIKDYDGHPSIGQDLYLEMSETGKVKASRVEIGAITSEYTEYQELGEEAISAIRAYDLAEHGGVISLNSNLAEDIEKAGGRGPYTMSMIKTVKEATPDLSVAEHLIWQYLKTGDSIQCKIYIPSSIERVRFLSENLFNPKFNTSTPHVFFKEYVGKNYKMGLGGYRTLVVGESMFCTKNKEEERCPYFDVCTSNKLMNSSAFDKKCPYSDVPLSDYTCYNVECFLEDNPEGEIKSYERFTDLMKDIGVIHRKEDLFDRIVFYDYMQYFGSYDSVDLSDRDDLAFEEIVHKHDPSVIIIWGSKVGKRIKRKGKYTPRNIQGNYDMDYIFNQKIAGRWRTFLCIDHPSPRNPYLSIRWDEHVKQARLIFK